MHYDARGVGCIMTAASCTRGVLVHTLMYRADPGS